MYQSDLMLLHMFDIKWIDIDIILRSTEEAVRGCYYGPGL